MSNVHLIQMLTNCGTWGSYYVSKHYLWAHIILFLLYIDILSAQTLFNILLRFVIACSGMIAQIKMFLNLF